MKIMNVLLLPKDIKRLGLVTGILVILKLTGYSTWSWIWVFSPIWIVVLVILIVGTVALIFWIEDRWWG